MMLRELTQDARYEEIILSLQEDEKKAGGMNMCELLDKYENRGLERGMAQGMACVNDLIRHLIGDGRIDEIERAVSDMEYQNKLLAEYGI